jgi:hypothetical protein
MEVDIRLRKRASANDAYPATETCLSVTPFSSGQLQDGAGVESTISWAFIFAPVIKF